MRGAAFFRGKKGNVPACQYSRKAEKGNGKEWAGFQQGSHFVGKRSLKAGTETEATGCHGAAVPMSVLSPYRDNISKKVSG
jgi:hypothetical protein